MSKFLIIVTFCCFSFLLSAQIVNCTHYEQYMQEGEAALLKGDYNTAAESFFYAVESCFKKKEIVAEVKFKQALEALNNKAKSDPNLKPTVLDLSNQYLTEIPPSVFEQTQLKILLLKSNQIQKIPEGMRNLKNLICLDLSSNQISKIENLDNLPYY